MDSEEQTASSVAAVEMEKRQDDQQGHTRQAGNILSYICLFAGFSANPLIYPKISDSNWMSSLAWRLVEGQDPPAISHALSKAPR